MLQRLPSIVIALLSAAILTGTAFLVYPRVGFSFTDFGFGSDEPQAPSLVNTADGVVLQAPTVFKHPTRNFSFTLPKGWSRTSGSMEAGSAAVFKKHGVPVFFQFHFTPMAQSFPALASVEASLLQAEADMEQGKLRSATRRDNGENDAGLPMAIGWMVVEAPGEEDAPQRMIWQCYDRENVYYNFLASTTPALFATHEEELKAVFNSIVFK